MDYQSNWVFDLVLRLAVVVCLGTLALGLAIGIGPLTASLRSGVAFFAFVALGWAVARVCDAPNREDTQVEAQDDVADSGQPPAAKP
jgi:hypothetical protein